MIEVEVRGKLSETEARDLTRWLRKSGRYLRRQERELILLKDGYPGYDADSLKRKTDIRFKDTRIMPTGSSEIERAVEIVVKTQASDGNVGRFEYAYSVEVDSIDALRPLARAFGATRGLWMQRNAEVFEHAGLEWAVIAAVSRDGTKTIYHFEIELGVDDSSEIPAAEVRLEAAADARGVTILRGKAHAAFIDELGREVNEHVSLEDLV